MFRALAHLSLMIEMMLEKLLPLLCMLCVALVAFASATFVAYGYKTARSYTWGYSLVQQVFGALNLGDDGGVVSSSAFHVDLQTATATFFTLCFVLTVVIFLMSLLVAILTNTYENASSEGSVERFFAQRQFFLLRGELAHPPHRLNVCARLTFEIDRLWSAARSPSSRPRAPPTPSGRAPTPHTWSAAFRASVSRRRAACRRWVCCRGGGKRVPVRLPIDWKVFDQRAPAPVPASRSYDYPRKAGGPSPKDANCNYDRTGSEGGGVARAAARGILARFRRFGARAAAAPSHSHARGARGDGGIGGTGRLGSDAGGRGHARPRRSTTEPPYQRLRASPPDRFANTDPLLAVHLGGGNMHVDGVGGARNTRLASSLPAPQRNPGRGRGSGSGGGHHAYGIGGLYGYGGPHSGLTMLANKEWAPPRAPNHHVHTYGAGADGSVYGQPHDPQFARWLNATQDRAPLDGFVQPIDIPPQPAQAARTRSHQGHGRNEASAHQAAPAMPRALSATITHGHAHRHQHMLARQPLARVLSRALASGGLGSDGVGASGMPPTHPHTSHSRPSHSRHASEGAGAVARGGLGVPQLRGKRAGLRRVSLPGEVSPGPSRGVSPHGENTHAGFAAR